MKNSLLFQDFFIYLSHYSIVFFKAYYYEKFVCPFLYSLLLCGVCKGGVLAAIAREKPVPVYFIGVGEKLEDLQTFNAREFAQALLA